MKRFILVGSVLMFSLVLLSANALAVDPDSIRSKHIVDGQVKAKDIADEAIKASKIRDGAVKGRKIADGTITKRKLAFDPTGIEGPEGPQGEPGPQGWVPHALPAPDLPAPHPDLQAPAQVQR